MIIVTCIFALVVFIGMICSLLMLSKTTNTPIDTTNNVVQSLSIVIPARNEEHTLPILLKSIQMQSIRIKEVIIIDDGSTDQTHEIGLQYGAKVYPAEIVNGMSPGKANACAYGASKASGDYLLFLDADIYFHVENALNTILTLFTHQNCKGLLSMQPYHIVKKPYENLSVIFNIVVVTGINVFSIWKNRFHSAGSFGPCILTDSVSYRAVGGFESISESIMDDFALSDLYRKKELTLTNYTGKNLLNMRMYSEGVRELIEGWTKNVATGSKSTNKWIMVMITIWIFAALTVSIVPLVLLSFGKIKVFLLFLCLYLLFGISTAYIASKVGKFTHLLFLIYPIYFYFFIIIFLYSAYRTNILHSVVWKGRKVKV